MGQNPDSRAGNPDVVVALGAVKLNEIDEFNKPAQADSAEPQRVRSATWWAPPRRLAPPAAAPRDAQRTCLRARARASNALREAALKSAARKTTPSSALKQSRRKKNLPPGATLRITRSPPWSAPACSACPPPSRRWAGRAGWWCCSSAFGCHGGPLLGAPAYFRPLPAWGPCLLGRRADPLPSHPGRYSRPKRPAWCGHTAEPASGGRPGVRAVRASRSSCFHT